MRSGREEPETLGIAAQISRVAEGLGKLFAEHVTLARLELAEDAKTVGKHAGLVAVFLPFVFLGYALLCIALSFGLTRWMSLPAAFALVGGVNLLAGAVGVLVAIKRLRARPLLNDTVSELNRSASLIQTKDE